MTNTNNTVALPLITKSNVRYITGSASRKDGFVRSIKFRVFAETPAILKAIDDRLTKLKKTGLVGKLVSPKYNGWDLKLNVFYTEYVTKDRAEFQNAFKAAKRAAIEASVLARDTAALAEDNVVTDIAKAIAGTGKDVAAKVRKKGAEKK